jgi:hypothetical protein
MKTITMIGAAIVAQLVVYAIPVLALVNFIWLLVKDELLFSWMVIAYLAIVFIIAIAIILALYLLIARN